LLLSFRSFFYLEKNQKNLVQINLRLGKVPHHLVVVKKGHQLQQLPLEEKQVLDRH
jgi:hypothetical protein